MKLQKKIALAFSVVILITSILSSLVVGQLYSRRIEEEFDKQLNQGTAAIEQYFLRKSESGYSLSLILAKENKEVANFILAKTKKTAFASELEEWKKDLGIDYFAIGNSRGELLIQTNGDQLGQPDTASPLVVAVLSVEAQPVYGVEVYQDNILLSGLAPVYSTDQLIIGFIKASFFVEEQDILQLKKETGLDIELILPSGQILTTFASQQAKQKDFNLVVFQLKDLREEPLSVAITVGLPTDAFARAKQWIGYMVAISTGLMIFVSLGAILLLASRIIIHPLRDLAKAVSVIGQGNLAYRVKVKAKGGDETDLLGRSFNQMAADLQRSIKTLKKERASLELKVETRTKELQGLTKNLEAKVADRTEEIKEKMAETEAERDRTTSIIHNFADGLLLIEKDRVALINPQAREFFLIDGEKLIGKKVADLSQYSKIKPLAELIKNKGLNFSKEKLAWGESLILEVSTVPILKGKKEIGTIIILHDITREKVIERMKTEFVSIAAHQLRTPISAIKWILKMFLDGDLGALTSSQQEYLKKTYDSNERMVRLINDLLNVTRIEEGRFLQDVQKEDIVEIVTKRADIARTMTERKGLQFSFVKSKTKAPKVAVDKEKFSLTIQNLIDNAVHYTKKGSIALSFKFLKKKNEFLFSIKDTGIGIAKEQQDRVFGKFFRAANAIAAETEGTGLGLFIAKNVIEAHGGEIWFESKKGIGSTFYFTLPAR